MRRLALALLTVSALAIMPQCKEDVTIRLDLGLDMTLLTDTIWSASVPSCQYVETPNGVSDLGLCSQEWSAAPSDGGTDAAYTFTPAIDVCASSKGYTSYGCGCSLPITMLKLSADTTTLRLVFEQSFSAKEAILVNTREVSLRCADRSDYPCTSDNRRPNGGLGTSENGPGGCILPAACQPSAVIMQYKSDCTVMNTGGTWRIQNMQLRSN